MKKQSNLPIIVILLIGLSLLVYPSFANWFNNRNYDAEISEYVKILEKEDNSETEEILKNAEEYNRRLSEKIFSLELSEDMYEEYMNQLAIEGSEVMSTIQIPSINVSLPIYHTTEDRVLDSGVGHIEGTSLPVGGLGTHCVLSGHRGLPSSKLFTDLDKVKENDYFIINTFGRKMYYQVDKIIIVYPEEVSDLQIDQNEDYCTLVTCTPYGVNTHRLLVRGHRIDEIPNISVLNDAIRIDSKYVALFIIAVVFTLAAIYTLIKKDNKK